MTIYSQHPSRGKVQILATYRGLQGVVSSTVTSVDTAVVATLIVDALNRISACATVPVSVYDERGRGFGHYPATYLRALTDRDARTALLEGAHSLWYEHVKLMLYRALVDLDDATGTVPAPVRTAIDAELEAEARGLRDELAEYSEGIEPPDPVGRRCWEFEAPFAALDGIQHLSHRIRGRLDRVEQGASNDQLRSAVDDMRLLTDVFTRCSNSEIHFVLDELLITDDPFDADPAFYLNVEAPSPIGEHGRNDWLVAIGQWVPDDPEEDDDTATGELVVVCSRPTRPTAEEIIQLLNRSGGRSDQLATWAKTPVGDALAGTRFVVTERSDSPEEGRSSAMDPS